MKKIFVVCLAAAGLIGCDGSSGVKQVSGEPVVVNEFESASIEVTSAVPGKDALVSALDRSISNELETKNVFSSVRTAGEQSDLVVMAMVTETNELGALERIMSEDAGLRVSITVKRRDTGEVLGRIVASASSSDGEKIAGTTSGAVDEVATGLASYLLENRRG